MYEYACFTARDRPRKLQAKLGPTAHRSPSMQDAVANEKQTLSGRQQEQEPNDAAAADLIAGLCLAAYANLPDRSGRAVQEAGIRSVDEERRIFVLTSFHSPR